MTRADYQRHQHGVLFCTACRSRASAVVHFALGPIPDVTLEAWLCEKCAGQLNEQVGQALHLLGMEARR